MDFPSQLSYLSCKPLYVVAEKLAGERLEELKEHPERYKTPEPQINTLRANTPEPAPIPSPVVVESKYRPPNPSPIIIDLDDEEEDNDCKPPPTLTLAPKPAQQSVIPVFNRTSSKPGPAKRPKTSAKPVIYVDLCSSDEEDNNLSPCMSTDENRDPLRKMPEVSIEPHFMSGLSGTKLFSKPLVFHNDSRIAWQTNKNVDGDNTAQSILKNCTIPIL